MNGSVFPKLKGTSDDEAYDQGLVELIEETYKMMNFFKADYGKFVFEAFLCKLIEMLKPGGRSSHYVKDRAFQLFKLMASEFGDLFLRIGTTELVAHKTLMLMSKSTATKSNYSIEVSKAVEGVIEIAVVTRSILDEGLDRDEVVGLVSHLFDDNKGYITEVESHELLILKFYQALTLQCFENILSLIGFDHTFYKIYFGTLKKGSINPIREISVISLGVLRQFLTQAKQHKNRIEVYKMFYSTLVSIVLEIGRKTFETADEEVFTLFAALFYDLLNSVQNKAIYIKCGMQVKKYKIDIDETKIWTQRFRQEYTNIPANPLLQKSVAVFTRSVRTTAGYEFFEGVLKEFMRCAKELNENYRDGIKMVAFSEFLKNTEQQLDKMQIDNLVLNIKYEIADNGDEDCEVDVVDIDDELYLHHISNNTSSLPAG